MSENAPTKEEQIRILTAKVSQLESVCACIIEFFARVSMAEQKGTTSAV